MKLPLLVSFASYFTRNAGNAVDKPKARHCRHSGRQNRSIQHLVAHGEITLADIGGNHPAKVVMRLRQQGFIKRRGVPGGERWQTNPRTGCDYKVYIWTGKLPLDWLAPERRKTVRPGQHKRRGGRT